VYNLSENTRDPLSIFVIFREFVIDDNVGFFIVIALVDENKVVIKMHGNYLSVVVGFLIPRDDKFLMVQSISQIFKKIHQGFLIPEVMTIPAIRFPVGGLGVFDYVYTTVLQQREKNFKC